MNEKLKKLKEASMPAIDWKARHGVELNNGESLAFYDQWFENFANLIIEEYAEQSYELMGVVADVEEGDGFDAVCLNTIKRVQNALAGGALMSDKGYSVGSFDDPKFKETRAKYSDIISDGGMDPRK